METRLLSTTKRVTPSARSIDGGSIRYRQLYKMLLLLGSLQRGPLYGNELYHMIQASSPRKMTGFYATLDRLVAARCVYYEVVPGLGTGRGRRIYTLTHKGYRQFSALLSTLLLTEKALPGEVEIALSFLDHLPEAEVLTLLQARHCRLVNQRMLTLDRLTGQANAAISSHGISYRLYLLDAELAWIDQMVGTLQKTSVSASLQATF